MLRTLGIGLLALVLISCQGGPDRSSPLPALPDKPAPRAYGELLERARLLANNANSAFYVDNWEQVQEAGRQLEQLALFLPRAEDAPAKQKVVLTTLSNELGKLARQLQEMAGTKDVNKTNDVMRLIQLKVREMRLSDSN
jgi:hypothetical protein